MLKAIAWSIAKPFVKKWLSERALIVPASKRAEIAARTGLTAIQVGEVNSLIREYALEELEQFKP